MPPLDLATQHFLIKTDFKIDMTTQNLIVLPIHLGKLQNKEIECFHAAAT